MKDCVYVGKRLKNVNFGQTGEAKKSVVSGSWFFQPHGDKYKYLCSTKDLFFGRYP